MMRRPSLTASIGPSPVLGFMAAMMDPLSWNYFYYPVPERTPKNEGAESGRYGGVQSYPLTHQQTYNQPNWPAIMSTTTLAR
ncbi:MAG: hypothetical protein JWN36_1212 [Microbacteriaceae bacterium]|nr:hypothetical protein [Microbacteriaceae bacterium]